MKEKYLFFLQVLKSRESIAELEWDNAGTTLLPDIRPSPDILFLLRDTLVQISNSLTYDHFNSEFNLFLWRHTELGNMISCLAVLTNLKLIITYLGTELNCLEHWNYPDNQAFEHSILR